MKRAIYIFSSGELHRESNTLSLVSAEGKKFVPVTEVSDVYIFGEVTLNKRTLEFLSSNEVTLHLFNYYGYYVGSFIPRTHYNSGFMIVKQVEHYLDANRRIKLAAAFVRGAIANMLKVLKYYSLRGCDVGEYLRKIEEHLTQAPLASSVEGLMGIEGNCRSCYYEALNAIIRDEKFAFSGRSKRPPTTRLNSLISFGNSLLYTAVLSEIYKTHLDPRIGFLHESNFRRFTLNLDVAEIFKPLIVDRVLLTLINKGMFGDEHFMEELNGVFLNDKGRSIFVREFDEKLKTTIKHDKLGRSVSYRRLIRLELYKLERHLMGEKEYEPLVARW